MRAQEQHGMSSSAEYGIWRTMISRCHDENTKSYPDYGGRGIAVCERWRNSFIAFHADMGPRPSSEHSLDRRDNDLGYFPGNVFWRTSVEQNNNRSSNRRLMYRDQSFTLAELSRMSGLGHKTISQRLAKGDSVEEALRPVTSSEKRYTHNGRSLTIREWAAETGIDREVLKTRLVGNKIPIERALSQDSLRDNLIEYNGKRQSVTAWSRELRIDLGTLRTRLFQLRWPVDRAFGEPVHAEKRNLSK